MDGHIARLLNIGVAMMLLVLGLSVFFTQMMPLMTYESDAVDFKDSRMTDTGSLLDDYAVKSEIYLLIAEGPKVALTEGGPGISIYIDGTYCPKAVDYHSRRQLAQLISGTASDHFDKVITLDDQGQVTAIHYVGR